MKGNRAQSEAIEADVEANEGRTDREGERDGRLRVNCRGCLSVWSENQSTSD